MLLELNVFFVAWISIVADPPAESLEDVVGVHNALYDPGIKPVRGHGMQIEMECNGRLDRIMFKNKSLQRGYVVF